MTLMEAYAGSMGFLLVEEDQLHTFVIFLIYENSLELFRTISPLPFFSLEQLFQEASVKRADVLLSKIQKAK